MSGSPQVVVLISANAEWRVIKEIFPQVELQHSPYGEWFVTNLPPLNNSLRIATTESIGNKSIQTLDTESLLFFHGGWGKIAAAASTQYVIDRWSPVLLVNLGTCGGFEGEIERGAIILVEKTIVYDIIEQMGDFDEHIAHYTTEIDLSWLGEDYPQQVQRTLLVSGDRDLMVTEIPSLKKRYGAVAGDWESGAIAFVASRNATRCLILRGVTDLVGSRGGEAYGNIDLFFSAARHILNRLISALPAWVAIGMSATTSTRSDPLISDYSHSFTEGE